MQLQGWSSLLWWMAQSDQFGQLYCSDDDLARTRCHSGLYLAVTTQRSKPCYFLLVLGFFFSLPLVKFNMESQPPDNVLAECGQLCKTKLWKKRHFTPESFLKQASAWWLSLVQSTGINAAVYTGSDLHSSHICKSKTRVYFYNSHLFFQWKKVIYNRNNKHITKYLGLGIWPQSKWAHCMFYQGHHSLLRIIVQQTTCNQTLTSCCYMHSKHKRLSYYKK